MAKRIVFIDSRVADLDLLISSFGSGTEYRVVDAAHDRIVQIASALAGKSDYSFIDIIYHGSSGAITIGSTHLATDNLLQYHS